MSKKHNKASQYGRTLCDPAGGRYAEFENHMKYALVNEVKSLPQPKLKGACTFCGESTIAKCGSKVMWHWAHKRKCACDPWWENETQWHREWKNYWNDENQEITFFDNTGEKHVADVVNDQGVVIEIQNSPMSQIELKSREDFYGEMIWIINGRTLAKNMKLRAMLPDPENELLRDILVKATTHKTDFIYSYISEYEGPDELIEIHSSNKIKEITRSTHNGHFLFEWKRPRTVWYHSKKPVFIDFGKGILWKLMRFNKHSAFCIQAHMKEEFLAMYGGNA